MWHNWQLLEFVLAFFSLTSRRVGVLNSAIFNSFHNRVEFGTILEGLRNLGGRGVFEHPTPPHLGTPLLETEIEFVSYMEFVLQNNSASDVTYCFLKREINGRRQSVWCALEAIRGGKVAVQELATAQESLFERSLLRSSKPRCRHRISSGNCSSIAIFNGTNTNVCCS